MIHQLNEIHAIRHLAKLAQHVDDLAAQRYVNVIRVYEAMHMRLAVILNVPSTPTAHSSKLVRISNALILVSVEFAHTMQNVASSITHLSAHVLRKHTAIHSDNVNRCQIDEIHARRHHVERMECVV